MAKLRGPLFSLDARGALGKTIVYLGWKGIKTARQYVVPANPQTTDQTTQRNALASCVSAWKNYLTNAVGRASWNRIALRYAKAMAGFNAFMTNALKLIVSDPDATFVLWSKAVGGEKLVFYTVNLDDGAVGDEAGNFEVWVGSTPTNMVLNEEVALAGGNIIGTEDLGDVGDTRYIKLRKGGYDRGGINKITLE